MLKKLIKSNLRRPFAGIAMVLFAAALTVALCYLHQTGEEERKSYEASFASTPVFFKITDFDGSAVKDADGIAGWMAELFTEDGLTPNLAPFVGELHVRVAFPEAQYGRDTVTVTGITSTRMAEELTAGWGGSIAWLEGYDEEVFLTDEWVCVLPAALEGTESVTLTFNYVIPSDRMPPKTVSHTQSFSVVGYYTDPGNSRFYVPYPAMEWLYAKLGASKLIEGIGAILKDNNDLPALREEMSYWFASPNPAGEKTPWGKFDFDYYFYALDIDDNLLNTLTADMQSRLLLNRFAATAVLLMAAGASFLTGFFVIRSRKRELSLMRTLGASQKEIFLELFLEQGVRVLLGIFAGGWFFRWQAVVQLSLFCGISLAGLALALAIFLRANLLSTMKEDD
ncbi:MAG: ABC transporter permease [Clostridia bacterium]|nr:ABC transporter permease [Clostridia bacterium]